MSASGGRVARDRYRCLAGRAEASALPLALSKQSKHCHTLTSVILLRRLRAPRAVPWRCSRITIVEVLVPNIASAKKNMRKTRAATARNRAQRSALRTALKKARAAGATPDAKLQAVKLLDRAARKGLIHKNAAGRYKSRLAKAS